MRINKDMTFAEILSHCPECGEVLFKFGLHCIGCHLSPAETLEQGAKAHGLSDSQVDEMIKELNKKLKDKG
ncbi:disulfide oxidoreductase [Candidatus Woesearchaeota archaeon]|nr:DUF1858 domain-containing protein [Candidatus Woesearchaeota archaeon]RLE43427.1 MAG: disulfide oxidoreductase [Candidatus Woesearchaeota archaeon]